MKVILKVELISERGKITLQMTYCVPLGLQASKLYHTCLIDSCFSCKFRPPCWHFKDGGWRHAERRYSSVNHDCSNRPFVQYQGRHAFC